MPPSVARNDAIDERQELEAERLQADHLDPLLVLADRRQT